MDDPDHVRILRITIPCGIIYVLDRFQFDRSRNTIFYNWMAAVMAAIP